MVDFIVRGEGDIIVSRVGARWNRRVATTTTAACTYRQGDRFVHSAARPVSGLDSGNICLPHRAARVLTGYTALGRQIDVVETSRGCTFDCSFCSIIAMRGQLHPYAFDRVLADIRDARDAIAANLAFAQRYVDWPYIQHPTPYPRTPMTYDFRDRGLIINEHLEEYDGTTAVVKPSTYRRKRPSTCWKADRWMKLRHMPVALRYDPWFVLKHAPKMFAHTFRGATLKTFRLEDDHAAFARFKALRKSEREYL